MALINSKRFKILIPLIISIDTTLSDPSFEIPTYPSGNYLYDYNVDWGDGIKTSNHTSNASHSYINNGFYTITITGSFPKFHFNDTGDKSKIIRIDQWGSSYISQYQASSFLGCNNLKYLAGDMEWINNIGEVTAMFRDSGITELPEIVTLDSVKRGLQLFYQANLTSLPSQMTLKNLVDGSNMFDFNNLNDLPINLKCESLKKGVYMFRGNNLAVLPSSMVLDQLEDGAGMFMDNALTSLPANMNLNNLTNAESMFRNNPLASLPSNISLSKITKARFMFLGSTIKTEDYSGLLIRMNNTNTNNNVSFHGGNSKYNSTARIARENLVNVKGWTITDGGLEA